MAKEQTNSTFKHINLVYYNTDLLGDGKLLLLPLCSCPGSLRYVWLFECF